jgi:uncharacterized membrane protein YgcG
MNNTKSRFKTVTPIMIYVTPDDKEALSKYALDNKMTVSQIVREGIRMRLQGNDFNSGFNEGIQEAIKITHATEGAKMMFPSGKSFADLVAENVTLVMRNG